MFNAENGEDAGLVLQLHNYYVSFRTYSLMWVCSTLNLIYLSWKISYVIVIFCFKVYCML